MTKMAAMPIYGKNLLKVSWRGGQGGTPFPVPSPFPPTSLPLLPYFPTPSPPLPSPFSPTSLPLSDFSLPLIKFCSYSRTKAYIWGLIRKFAEKCYLIALLVSISMKIHRYKLPFIASWLKLKFRKCDVRRMSTRRDCDVTSLEPAHLYPWPASWG